MCVYINGVCMSILILEKDFDNNNITFQRATIVQQFGTSV